MKKWEYTYLISPTLEQMNKLGAEGWEMVASTSENENYEEIIYFKRPLVPLPKGDGKIMI